MISNLKFTLRVVMTASILWFIWRAIDHQQTLDILRNADKTLLCFAVLSQLASTTLAAYRWQLIMHNLAFGLHFDFYWRSYFKGMFFNQALPTSIGGDAVKILDLVKRNFRKRDAFYGVVIDRIIGLAALLALSLFAYLLHHNILPQRIYVAIVVLNVCGVLGFLSLLHLYKLPIFKRFAALHELLENISIRLQTTFQSNRLRILGSSLLIPYLAVLGFYLTGRALGLPFDLMTYFLIVPPAIVFTVIPLSIAGWGVREGALVTLFGLIGANKSAVLMMSIAYGFTLILVSLPGLLSFLRGRQRPHA